MKKICLIDFDMSVRGGVEQVTASLANALADYYKVYVVSLCLKGELAYSLDERVGFYPVLKDELRLREMQKQICPKLRAFFKEQDISVALIQETYAGFVTCPLRLFSKTKLIFCDHGSLQNQWDRKDMVVIRFLASTLGNRVVTLTERNQRDYQEKFHTPKKKLQTIYNWINLDGTLSKEYQLESQKIISVGRFGKEKGFDQLIKAFAPVAQKHPDWSLTVYGDGEMMPSVKELVVKYHLENQVQLPGMCTNLEKRYQEYAMYVLPSYREGLPLVLLEAKANRLPIVSFDILTGPREIVRDQIDGILVPPKDISALANAMNYLIEHPEVRKEMSDHSQENLGLFSKEKILAEWKSLIDSLL